MRIVYCSYSNIDSRYEQQFNEYWQQFHQGKTIIQHIYQNEKIIMLPYLIFGLGYFIMSKNWY